MKPLVSVIVPVYKVEKYLEQCINSLLAQTLQNIEIILVDDGSPDNCGQMCEIFKNKDKRIQVIHKKNEGLSAARNDGIKVAKGEYIGFVDSDDYISNDMFEKLYSLCRKNNTKIAACKFLPIVDEKQISSNTFSNCQILSSEEFFEKILDFEEGIEMVAWNKLYHRSIFENKDNYFPVGMLYEDLGTMYKLVFSTDKISFLNEKLYFYRCLRPGAITNRKYSFKENDRIVFGNEMIEFIRENVPNILNKAIIFKCINVDLSIINCMVYTNVIDKDMYNTIKKFFLNNIMLILGSNISYKKKIQIILCLISFNFYSFVFRNIK